MAKQTKFQKNLKMSHSDIRGRKADFIFEDAKAESISYIQEIESRLRNTNRSIASLEDLSPDSTTSLKVTPDGFNSKQWITELNNHRMNREIIQDELNVAKEIHTEYFGHESS
jgi:hypothetical protein